MVSDVRSRARLTDRDRAVVEAGRGPAATLPSIPDAARPGLPALLLS